SSGAHLNPAVTIALTVIEKFSWTDVPLYITAQLLGAATGALLVWFSYKKHFEETSDAELKLAVFCTGPAIRNTWLNLFSEILGTFILILGILFITAPSAGIGSLDALPVALLVLGIGLSLGGLTGYAINPARDLGPRIMHALLPIPGKRDSDWSYAWIPVAGPVIGALLAAGLKLLL
ncbi:MAG: MIP/aquaporin family protein, partial [Chitinophagaceae bacterium]